MKINCWMLMLNRCAVSFLPEDRSNRDCPTLSWPFSRDRAQPYFHHFYFFSWGGNESSDNTRTTWGGRQGEQSQRAHEDNEEGVPGRRQRLGPQ